MGAVRTRLTKQCSRSNGVIVELRECETVMPLVFLVNLNGSGASSVTAVTLSSLRCSADVPELHLGDRDEEEEEEMLRVYLIHQCGVGQFLN